MKRDIKRCLSILQYSLGFTYSQTGRFFNISPSRVGQIVHFTFRWLCNRSEYGEQINPAWSIKEMRENNQLVCIAIKETTKQFEKVVKTMLNTPPKPKKRKVKVTPAMLEAACRKGFEYDYEGFPCGLDDPCLEQIIIAALEAEDIDAF